MSAAIAAHRSIARFYQGERASGRAVRSATLPYATHLLASGANARLVSERLGHSSVAFTLDTYGHVLPGQQASAVAAVAALVENP